MMTEEIHINCPSCKSSLAVPKSHLEGKLQCWSCEKKFFYQEVKKSDEVQLDDLLFQENQNIEVEACVEEFLEAPEVKTTKKIVRGKSTQSSSRARRNRQRKSKSPARFILSFLMLILGAATYVIFQKPDLLKGLGVDIHAANQKVESGQHSDLLSATSSELNPSQVNIVNYEHYQILKDQCLSCHGEVVNGKAKIKGDFDIMPLLQSSNATQHTSEWIKVIEQIESGEMPPEEEEALKEDQIAVILAPLKSELNDSQVPARLLTSKEILNSSAQAFRFNKKSFDPFQALHFLADPNARFPTHNSIDLMSENYLYEIAQGVKGIYDLYLSRNTRPFHKKFTEAKRYKLRVQVHVNGSARYLDTDYDQYQDLMKTDKRAYNGAVADEKEKIHA